MTVKMKLNLKNRSHRYDINRPRTRHGHEHTKYVSQYNDGCTVKQYISNI